MIAINFVCEQLTMISSNLLVKSFMIKHFYYNSALMSVMDDDITPYNSS